MLRNLDLPVQNVYVQTMILRPHLLLKPCFQLTDFGRHLLLLVIKVMLPKTGSCNNVAS